MQSSTCRYLLLSCISLLHLAPVAAQDCLGAEIATTENYLYGRFETVMQSAAGSGIVSSFFLYNTETNCNWPAENNEIDVEMTGNNQQIYFTTHHPDPTLPWYYGENFYLGFDPHQTLHQYAIEWEPDTVRWFVDGVLIYTQHEAATNNLQYPMAIFMNLWAAKAEDWVGTWDPGILPRHSLYDYVKYYRYTPGEGNAGTGNNFTFEWEDQFDGLDTARWQVTDFGGFEGNYCTFRKNNVQTSNGKLLLFMDEPATSAELIPVAFSVNTAALGLSPADVLYLNGTFNNWCGTCMPMSKNGHIWETNIPLPPGKYEYLFTLNGWDAIGNAPMGSECDYNPCDEYANYGLLISSGSPTIDLETVCWKQCSDCVTSGTATPNPEQKNRTVVRIYDVLGRSVEARPGQLLFYLYDDWTIERKMILRE